MNLEIKNCLIEDKSGLKWYFYISDENRLLYSVKNSDGWSRPAAIDRYLIKYFSAAIDSRDNIYLIAYTHTKMLIYYEWNGYQWLHKTIHRIQSRFEAVPFFTLLTAGNAVHILYYIENALSRSRESLVHFHLSTNDWKRGFSLHYSSDDKVTPLDAVADNKGNIYFLYCTNKNNEYQWNCRILERSATGWSAPRPVYRTSCIPENIYFLPEENQPSLHISWTENSEDRYDIMYLRKDNLYSENQADNLTVLKIGESDKNTATALHIKDNDIYCFWTTKESLNFKAVNSNKGSSVSLQDTEDKRIEFYNHIYADAEGGTPSALADIGDGYPSFTLSALDYLDVQKNNGGLLSFDSNNNLTEAKQKKSSSLTTETDNGNTRFKTTDNSGSKKADNKKTEKADIASPKKTAHKVRSSDLSDDMMQLKMQINSLSSRLDELYSSLYIIRDQLIQHNKAIFNLEASAKILENIYNAKRRRTEYVNVASGTEGDTIQIKTQEGNIAFESREKQIKPEREENAPSSQSAEDLPKEDIPNGNEKGTDNDQPEQISLGNVRIIINPEDEC